MKYLLALFIVMGTLAAIRWLRQQQKRIEFDDHVDQAVALTAPDWALWEAQVSA